jgi:hypothetical protein
MTVDDAPSPCPQAWHGGLPAGLLVECRLRARHRGWHRSEDGALSWGGKLTADEVAAANALRTTA